MSSKHVDMKSKWTLFTSLMDDSKWNCQSKMGQMFSLVSTTHRTISRIYKNQAFGWEHTYCWHDVVHNYIFLLILFNKQTIHQSVSLHFFLYLCLNILTVQTFMAEIQKSPPPPHYWIWTHQRFCYTLFLMKSDHLWALTDENISIHNLFCTSYSLWKAWLLMLLEHYTQGFFLNQTPGSVL